MYSANQDERTFKREAHRLVDELPEDATWQDLVMAARFEIELEKAVAAAERAFKKQPTVVSKP